LRVILLISFELIVHRIDKVDFVLTDPSTGSKNVSGCVSMLVHDPIVLPVVQGMLLVPFNVVRRACPLFLINSGLFVIPSSIFHTCVLSCVPGFESSVAESIILFPALSVYSPIDVMIVASHWNTYTVLKTGFVCSNIAIVHAGRITDKFFISARESKDD
jgi:hypothetical protein